MLCDFTLVDFRRLYCGVATMTSLVQLRVQDSEKWRQCRGDNVRLTESGNARSKQLLVMPTELLTDCEGLPGELFGGSECSKARLVF